ncbi:MAG: S8 family serine peptidase [Verrucomicrobiales bacterium]|nr:S8 family serine peptidase [Verrucomicrobiales bacterium]
MKLISVSNRGEKAKVPESQISMSLPKYRRGASGSPSPESRKLLVAGSGELADPPAVDERIHNFAEIREIIGTDDRRPIADTTEFPWNSICALKGRMPDGTPLQGTGWLAGPQTVITAGHCLNHPDLDGWLEEVTVIPAADDGTDPFGSVVSRNFSTPDEWIEKRDVAFDIGVIHLPVPVHSDLVPLGFAALEDEKLVNQLINITGYPYDKGGDQMWHGRDRIIEAEPETLRYQTDTKGGQSGSPAYLICSFTDKPGEWSPLVAGIHSRRGEQSSGGVWQDNCAVRITPEIFDLINFWIDESETLVAPNVRIEAVEERIDTPLTKEPASAVPTPHVDKIPSAAPEPIHQLIYVPGEVVLSAPAEMKRTWDAHLFGHSIGARSILFYYNDLVDELNKPLIVSAQLYETILNQITQRFGEEARDFVRELSKNVNDSGDKALLFGVEATLQWLILATTYFYGGNDHDGRSVKRRIKERFIDELEVVGRDDKLIVITRGFGTVIAYDVLRDPAFTDHPVDRLISMGNPLAYPAIKNQFTNDGFLPFPKRVNEWKDIAISGDPVAAEEPCFDSSSAPYERVPNITGISEEILQRPLGEAYLVQDKVVDLICEPLPREFDAPLQNFLVANNLADRMAERMRRMPVLIQLDFRGKKSLEEKARHVVDLLKNAYLQNRSNQSCSEKELLADLRLDIMNRYVAAELLPREVSYVELKLRQESDAEPTVHRIWQNSRVRHLLDRSRSTIQADAAESTYQADGKEINWAVLDTGVDRSHPHFRHPDCCGPEGCAIAEALDFTTPNLRAIEPELKYERYEEPSKYYNDPSGHGTHVAAIIAGKSPCGTYSGIAPQTRLHCYKVLDDRGRGNEASIIRALEYIYDQNSTSHELKIHGVNVSLGCDYDPTTYGCGHSPICTELRRLWNQGVVVCVAAGNTGRMEFGSTLNGSSKFLNMDMNVGDPANLEEAISVGSIHKSNPHTYGISYFSSKGPTADGRVKPDCVAPGEKIWSADAGRKGYRPDSGTSMACPHVSGMIASFLSRRREFIGQPDVVKRILLENCTDLKRDKFHQGAGLPNLMKMLANT